MQFWANHSDIGPALCQYQTDVLKCICYKCPGSSEPLLTNTKPDRNDGSMLGLCRRRWANFETTLAEHLVFAKTQPNVTGTMLVNDKPATLTVFQHQDSIGPTFRVYYMSRIPVVVVLLQRSRRDQQVSKAGQRSLCWLNVEAKLPAIWGNITSRLASLQLKLDFLALAKILWVSLRSRGWWLR